MKREMRGSKHWRDERLISWTMNASEISGDGYLAGFEASRSDRSGLRSKSCLDAFESRLRRLLTMMGAAADSEE